MLQANVLRVTLLACFSSACILESSVQNFNEAGAPGMGEGGQSQPDAGQGSGQPGIDAGQWNNVTANLAGMRSECGDLTFLSSRVDRDMIIAGVAQHGLWANINGGLLWSQLGQGPGSAVIINRLSSIVYDPDHPDTFWESGIYNGGGVYQTIDNGQTFVQLGNVTHSDGVSVDFTDPSRQTLLAGGHEQTKLYRSTDGGNTWVDVAPNIPAGAGYTVNPLVLTSQALLVGSYSGTASGVFRTADGGSTWSRVYSGGVRGHPLVAADKSIYWLLDADAGLIRSTDDGASWMLATGRGPLSALAGGASLVELPDGRLVSLGTGSLMISANQGGAWRALGPMFPFHPQGVVYSTSRKAFYIWHFDCNFVMDVVLPDAILASTFDYKTQ